MLYSSLKMNLKLKVKTLKEKNDYPMIRTESNKTSPQNTEFLKKNVSFDIFDWMIILVVILPNPKKIVCLTPEWIHRAEYNCVLSRLKKILTSETNEYDLTTK